MEVKGKLIEAHEKDKYVPFRTTSWVWKHVHLRYSDDGQRWWCNHCAWDVRTDEATSGSLGVKKYLHGGTSNMESHLRLHNVTRLNSDKVKRGELTPLDVQERWSEEGQRRGALALTKWIAKDKLSPNIVMGAGFRVALNELLGGRMRPPHRGTIVRHAAGLKQEHDTRVVCHVQELAKYEFPMGVVQVDIWEAPNKQHWMAVILHSVSADFVKTRLVLYFGKIADKGAREQAQRIISICNQMHINPDHLIWVVGTDNTPSAYNVARELQKEILRCGAHVIALGPKHMFYPVKRMRDDGAGGREEVLAIHEDADEEAFRLLEKIRREHKRVREIQANRLKFDAVQNRPIALIAIGDSAAKWVGMSPMLERRWVLRDDFEALVVKHPEIFLDIGGICSADQVIAVRDICAVLSDWRQAVNVMQSDHLGIFADHDHFEGRHEPDPIQGVQRHGSQVQD